MGKYLNTSYRYYLIGVFIIFLSCIISYSNTLNSPFVFDDLPNIKNNRFIQLSNFDAQKLYDAGFKGPSRHRPVPKISFAINYYFGQYDVRGFHIVNIIMHLINGVLAFFLALAIFRQVSEISNQSKTECPRSAIFLMSLFAALIFLTHAIQTQSVTYIVQRMNIMAVMFYLLSLLLYIRARLSRTKWRRWLLFFGCCISWIMALGSKEITATLPFIILLYEWFFFQDLKSDWLRRNWWCIIGLIVIFGLVAFIYLKGNPIDKILGVYEHRDFTLSERALTQFRVVVFYISLLLFPHPSRLNLLHHVQTTYSVTSVITTLLSMLIIIGLIVYAIYSARKKRLISFCILWFFTNLVIESSIIGLEMIFEHRLYLPMFGFALIISYLLFNFLSKRRSYAIVIAVCIILSLGTATYTRNEVWKDPIKLWSDVISKNSQSHRAHGDLGIALKEQGRIEEAIDHYYEALRIKPDDAKAHSNLGNALKRQGRIEEAIAHFSEALRIKPEYAEVHNNLGIALKEQGRIEEAIDQYYEALRIKPNDARAHNNLGNALKRQGRIEEAIDHYYEALRIEPDYADAHNNLGNTHLSQGRTKEAIKHYHEVLRIKPNHANAHNNLGVLHLQQGRLNEAVRCFSEALRISPGIAETHNNLGVAFLRQGKHREAISHFSEALRIRPGYVDAKNNRDLILRQFNELTEMPKMDTRMQKH